LQSSAIAVASTTVRKVCHYEQELPAFASSYFGVHIWQAVTMALSIFLFGHAFTLYHVTALGMLGLSV
jgi:hypothetical protein